jgi:hypothetical protein
MLQYIIINNDNARLPRPHFAAQNFYGHAKAFPRKLSTVLARAVKNARQPDLW